MHELQSVPTLIRSHQFHRALELIDAYSDPLLPIHTNTALWYTYRGIALYFTGNFARSIESYEHALRLDPDYLSANINLAHIYACCPDQLCHDARRAIRLSRHACHLSRWRTWLALQAVTTSYMRAGDFPTARRFANMSMTLATVEQGSRVEILLACIENKRPFTTTLELDLAKMEANWSNRNERTCG